MVLRLVNYVTNEMLYSRMVISVHIRYQSLCKAINVDIFSHHLFPVVIIIAYARLFVVDKGIGCG